MIAPYAPNYDKLGFLWLIYPLAKLADERADAGAFRQALSVQNTVRERLAGHHEKHEGPNCDEVVSAFHLNAPLHCLSDVWRNYRLFPLRGIAKFERTAHLISDSIESAMKAIKVCSSQK